MKKTVLYIGNALSDKGQSVTTIDTLSEHLKAFSKVIVSSNKRNKALRLMDMIATLWINRKKIDVVLIDTYSTSNFYYALVISQLSRLYKLNYIPILHGGRLEQRLKKSQRWSKLIFKNAFCLVAPSLYMKTLFESYGYHQIRYVPNSINLTNYAFQPRPIGVVRLFWLRAIAEIYNPMMAIRVLEELNHLGYEVSLTMVGPDKEGFSDQLSAYAEGKQLKLNITGLLPKAEWISLSAQHNIFINTANIDNTPVSVIEAMALGLPVISTNVGGLPFLIRDGIDGILVNPNDAKAMTAAIIKLIDHTTLRKNLVENARLKVENFDWKVVQPLWEDLLS